MIGLRRDCYSAPYEEKNWEKKEKEKWYKREENWRIICKYYCGMINEMEVDLVVTKKRTNGIYKPDDQKGFAKVGFEWAQFDWVH